MRFLLYTVSGFKMALCSHLDHSSCFTHEIFYINNENLDNKINKLNLRCLKWHVFDKYEFDNIYIEG